MAELQAAIDDANRHLKGTDNDSKVTALHALEQELNNSNGHDVDATSLESVASLLKSSLRNGNSHIYTAGLSCTLAFFAIADEHWHSLKDERHPISHFEIVFKNAVNTLALPPGGLLTFLGDAKDSVRSTARAALLQAAKTSANISGPESRLQPDQQPLALLDKLFKEHGFGSKNAKIREQSLLYITELRAACPALPLRAWVPILVNALEDSDPVVRDVARESVITVFTAPSVGAAAKSDLKKELVKNNVRKTTTDIVLRRTLGGGIPTSSSSLTSSPPSQGSLASDTMSSGRRTPSLGGKLPPRPPSVASMGRSPSSGSLPRPSTGTSSGSFKPSRGDRLLKEPKNKTHEELLADLEAVAAANAPPPSTGEGNVVQVVYIASVRDLEQEFAAMQPCFAGKETEFNWQEREKAIFRIRGMLKGNVHQTHRSAFIAGLKTAVEGILKAVNSLRTTLAAATCQLVAELAENLKESLTPLFEPLYAGLLKLASLTKKSIAQASQDAVDALLRECTFQHKSLPMLAAMLDQKNVPARIYTAQHLKVLVESQARAHKEAIETSPHAGLSLLSQMLKKELADANATVREVARATFWTVQAIWPELGQSILESVDISARKALEKVDPRQHQSGIKAQQAGTTSASTKKPVPTRPSIKELISSRRATQNTLSSSTSDTFSVSIPARQDVAGPATGSPARGGRMHNTRRQSSTPSTSPPTRPRLSETKTTPTKRPSSFYGSVTTTHIPSPPHSTQHSPRSRTFSGDLGQSRGPNQTHRSIPAQTIPQSNLHQSRTHNLSRDITQPALPLGHKNRQPSPYSSRSSSPPLHASAAENEYSDIEASTFNAIPDGLESTDDESVNLLNYNTTLLHPSRNGHADPDLSERSRILDGLMDTSFDPSDNIEVEEAVKGLADQAEQTAHRFLELTEPEGDIDEGSAGDATILEHVCSTSQDVSSQDIPVPSTPHARRLPSHTSNGAPGTADDEVTTPLVQRMQALHLSDSPAGGVTQRSPNAVLTAFTQDQWWLDKAAFPPAREMSSAQQALEVLADAIETKTIDNRGLLQVARHSQDLPLATVGDLTRPALPWTADGLCGRLVDRLCNLLKESDDDTLSFHCLIALWNLVTHHSALLDGRELTVLELLFDISRTRDKTVRTGAECVALAIVSITEPLYAASCLRMCLGKLPEAASATIGDNEGDGTSAWTFAMGLKAMGALFSLLPSEVLQEEVVRSRDLIKKAFNSPQAGLRQTAATVLVKAHQVIQDDTKLFALVDGLTKSQINLCTYLFARSTVNS